MRILGKSLSGVVVLLLFAAGSWAGKAELVRTLKGDAANDNMGTSVAWIGDVDGDGSEDLAVGAHFASNSRGLVRIHSGADASVLHTLNGVSSGEKLGRSVAAAGDVNADGFPDILVGAHMASSYAGVARVHSGKDGSTLFTFPGKGTQ
ncbi:MAG: integrin alpha, partial [Planctomycetes bacterium]|nr:integrin alpha [Planctomycetota bacterium]